MNTIHRLLAAWIVLAVFAAGCQGEHGPVGPVSLARDSNVVAHDYEPPLDSLVVSFEGTRIRITNTSGGSRVATNKLIIFHADWNIHAWIPEDSTAVIDVTEEVWTDYIGDHIRIRLHCRNHDDFLQMGSNSLSPLKYDLFVLAAREDDPSEGVYFWDVNNTHRAFQNCDNPFLSIVDQSRTFSTRPADWPIDVPISRDDEIVHNTGGTWNILSGEIPLDGVDFFTAPRLSITYHPVVSDSSQISRETLWLQTIVDDRMGFVEYIDRMLPVDAVQEKTIADGASSGSGDYSSSVFNMGDVVYVPPDPINCKDGIYEAIDILADGYSGWINSEVGVVKLAVAVMSGRVFDNYCGPGYGGLGYVGGPFSVLVYETDRDKVQAQLYQNNYNNDEGSILVHEIGHNLGLGHTPTFHYPDIPSPARDYPLASGFIDRNGYLVRDIRFQEVHVWDAGSTYDFMTYSSPTWVSNYNWNKMLDYLNVAGLPVSARVDAGGDQMWICNGQH